MIKKPISFDELINSLGNLQIDPPKYQPPFYTIHELDCHVFNLLDIKKYNAVVAGGAALAWYQNQPVGSRDIDIYFPSEAKQRLMSHKLGGMSEFHRTFDSTNAETWKTIHNGKIYRIQLIKTHYSKDVKEIIDNFDITVCQCATDGDTWWVGDRFVQDLKDMRLHLTKFHKGSSKRLVKYWCYGFQPTDETIETLINDQEVSWEFDMQDDEDYENAK